ncbi:L-proline cis-3-hydroxylase [Amycolatopsis regifaucium]|uniref:L-proline cis-3-hydroxylase n=1 Tax=Amycolatopsis regifaucium TaxID=546365 RepID=A0A154MN10_9PSEU|nr:L-proline cis-3-hydroxylase [Amycolatopsis regifaucium]OKA03587.1 L-proline cis-3-hydroxylase [Amycolatopsis regifaucium]SFJ51299.1 Aspartyl/Asparaginyl beta-hydroxylase [Amycolatopsis regifaucium]
MRSHIVGKVDLDKVRLQQDLEALAAIPRVEEEYDEFSSGYWKNLSLWNSSGEADDTMYRDIQGAAKPTAHAAKAPYLDELIRTVFDPQIVKMARARNLVDAMVIPHRDFIELNKDNDQYFRTFMVLEDNESAFHSDDDTVIHMRPGEIWYLDAAAPHSAVNFSSNSRQSLCVDFAFDGPFTEDQIFSEKSFYQPALKPDIVARKPFTDEHRNKLVRLGEVIDKDNFKDILFLMSRVHYRYDVPAAETYTWFVEACHLADDATLVARAEGVRDYMIGQRALGERLLAVA